MTEVQFLKNLRGPEGKIDVILDTDAFNEIDDQFAISYLMASEEKCRIRALCAAPFCYNPKAETPKIGMEKSYQEILKLISLAGREELREITYRGSEAYLTDKNTPVKSEAADAIIRIANEYSSEHPLYLVAIGAITNVASALIADPGIAEKVVIVWLGGNAWHWPDTREYNLFQDVKAAQVVLDCGSPFVQLPCMGVVSSFTLSGSDLKDWLIGKNPLADYLAKNTITEAESYAKGTAWTRIIWDVTTIGWLLNDGGRFMNEQIAPRPVLSEDCHFGFDYRRKPMTYVNYINRDALATDLLKKLTR